MLFVCYVFFLFNLIYLKSHKDKMLTGFTTSELHILYLFLNMYYIIHHILSKQLVKNTSCLLLSLKEAIFETRNLKNDKNAVTLRTEINK